MYDASKIVAGLAVFVVLATSPLWYNQISAASADEPELQAPPNGATQCVEATEYMRANHMDLLNQWRDRVVREDQPHLRQRRHRARVRDEPAEDLSGLPLQQEPVLRFLPHLHGGHALLLGLPRGSRGGAVMKSSRRGFLKFAGLSAVGVAGSAAVTTPGDEKAITKSTNRRHRRQTPGDGGRSAQVFQERRAAAKVRRCLPQGAQRAGLRR